MKKMLLSALAIACATSAFAYTEETEIMTVTLSDGTVVEYPVSEVEHVTFGTKVETTNLLLRRGGETLAQLEAVPTLFRVVPAADSGEGYGFGFGLVAAETPGDLCMGGYGVEVNVSASKINTGTLQLVGDETAPASVTMYVYDAEGAVAETMTELTAGTLFTAVDVKTKAVTFILNATFADGTEIYAEYKGKVVDVESLAGMNPKPMFHNELIYYNADGVASVTSAVTGCKRDTSYSGWPRFTFSFENSSAQKCTIEMQEQYFGKVLDFATLTEHAVNFTYGSIQLSGPNEEYRNQGLVGTICVTQNADGTYTIDADVTNSYKTAWGGTGGTPERVVLNYTESQVEVKAAGDGTTDNPYNCAAVISLGNPGTESWVAGYIVGVIDYNQNSELVASTSTVRTCIAIADKPGETDKAKCVPVQLMVGNIRNNLNLVDNPSLFGKKIAVKGSLEKYFDIPAVKSTSDYRIIFDGDEAGA